MRTQKRRERKVKRMSVQGLSLWPPGGSADTPTHPQTHSNQSHNPLVAVSLGQEVDSSIILSGQGLWSRASLKESRVEIRGSVGNLRTLPAARMEVFTKEDFSLPLLIKQIVTMIHPMFLKMFYQYLEIRTAGSERGWLIPLLFYGKPAVASLLETPLNAVRVTPAQTIPVDRCSSNSNSNQRDRASNT